MPLMQGLEVFCSSIHGYGVRATKPFEAGALLLYGDGVLYKEVDEFDDTYALICPNYLGDPSAEEGPALYWDLSCQSRWINHSCTPNSQVDTKWDANDKTIIAWWEAILPVRVGDELTYDYAFSGELAEPCHCNTAGCRGLIVDSDELDDVPPALRHLLRKPAA